MHHLTRHLKKCNILYMCNSRYNCLLNGLLTYENYGNGSQSKTNVYLSDQNEITARDMQ